MSKDHDFTAVQMHWQPPLIKLTQLPNPDHDNGEPTSCYISPQQIILISRGVTSFSKKNQDGSVPFEKREFYPAQESTFVVIGHSLSLQVLETPEMVAMLRDKALGHQPPAPKAVE